METEDDLLRFSSWLEDRDGGFALKPASGHGGAGIIVVDRKASGSFIRSSGRLIDRTRLVEHASRILKGTYSGLPQDRAFAEERIHLSRSLREIDTPGLLDIRIVTLRGFPLMAMTRLPTERSGGKANIHQGAIGAGISISEGRIISATHLRRTTKRHPGSGRALVGFRFNLWDSMLETASLAADASGLGYVGIDMTLDDRRGLVVIEVNKRPGLEIQNANGAGLLKRIRWVERQVRKLKLEPEKMGPGIKAELSRVWDLNGWEKGRRTDEMAEE
jgi:alpha-L-glutamate ligase-like protein